jgi:hypothetical protein
MRPQTGLTIFMVYDLCWITKSDLSPYNSIYYPDTISLGDTLSENIVMYSFHTQMFDISFDHFYYSK